MASKSFILTIGGHRWRIRLRRPLKRMGTDGVCFPSKKEIWLDPSASASRMDYLVAHEISHAVTEEMDELVACAYGDAVSQATQRIKKINGGPHA